MKYLSVCSGIEAATVAWHHMGWQPVAFSDIEPFPSAVLAHHYPNVPNLGDMTKFEEWDIEPIDLLVGGTPCQSFSVAGLRKGLADPRGNLMLTFLAIAERHRPRWIVWENVPGVLSSNGGRDFGAFLGALGELGYGWAYRVLDAQWFGVAQRRRRVFVVGCLGDWQRPAQVLFERESVRRDTAPSREKGQEVAGTIAARFGISRNNHEELAWPAQIASTLNASFGDKQGLEDQHALSGAPLFVPDKMGTITARMFNALGARDVEEGALLPVTFGAQMSTPQTDVDLVQTLQAKNPMAVAHALTARMYSKSSPDPGASRGGPVVVAQPVAMRESGQGFWMQDEIAGTLRAEGENRPSRPSNVIAQPVAIQGTIIGRSERNGPQGSGANQNGVMFTLTKTDIHAVAQPVAMVNMQGSKSNAVAQEDGPSYTLNAMHGHDVHAVANAMQVRRLTPVECERLQGFPDNYTNIPWRKKPESPDGPRYKALGNSMAVPVMRWIGERINKVSK